MIGRHKGIFTGCLIFSMTVSFPAMANNCELGRIASIDFTENGAIIIPVSVEGTNVRMAVDTGSPLSAIDPNVANNLHLIQRRIVQGFMYDIAGEPFTYVALPRDLGLGEMHASGADLLVWPAPMTKDGNLGGTLGADLLRHYDIDIDFGSHKIGLFSQDHCPGKVVYWTTENVAVVPVHVVNSGHVIVPVTLDGHSFDAVLDTGSSTTFLSQETAHNDFGLAPNSPDMIKVSDSGGPGGVPVYRHTFKGLELEGLSIGNPSVDIFENIARARAAPHSGSRISDADESGGNTDLILGLNELRHLHLYIAYREQKLYITPATASPAAAPAASPAAAAATPAAH